MAVSYPTSRSTPRLRARLAIGCIDPLATPPAADRILVIRLGAIGDVVRTLPAVAALRAARPGAHLAWLVEAPAESAVRGLADVDEVLVLPRAALVAFLRRGRWAAAAGLLRCFRRELRRRFDWVLDFHSILRSAVPAALSGAPRRVAYARPFGREGAWLLASERVRLPPARISRFERNAALLAHLGIDPDGGEVPLPLDPAARARMRARLGGGACAALHPGSSEGTPHKRYPVERYALVARELAARDGLVCLVTRGPGRAERAAAEALVEAAGGAARLAPETPSLADLALLFAACRVVVGSDTGPLHLAALVGTPVVQLLGPTDPVENAPHPAVPSRQLRVPVACSPCRRGCRPAPCVRGVAPASVAEAARALAARAAPPAAAAGGLA